MKLAILLLGLLARILTLAIPLFFINRHKEEIIQPISTWPTETILQISLSLIALIVADYMKDAVKNYKTKKSFNPLQRASRETGATVTTLLHHGSFSEKESKYIIESALRQIETIVEVSLSKSRHEGHEISANCMIFRTQRKSGPSLTLTHWGTRLAGREPISLRLNSHLPGAPKAIIENKTTYISNTQIKEHAELFSNKTYKSIISIPLTNGTRKIGVINIDSTEINAFGKLKTFNREVFPLIQPQLDTIKKLLHTAKPTSENDDAAENEQSYPKSL